MAIQIGKTLAITAVGGMVAGLAGCGGGQTEAKDPSGAAGTDAAGAHTDAAADKCSCKGRNECAGKGHCKTATNACAGQNDCKSKGGCTPAECKKDAAHEAAPAH